MTRQVALGAIVAFALTVLVLSVCQPTANAPPPSTPTPPAVAQPEPPNGAPVVGTVAPVKPLMMRPAAVARPELIQPRALRNEPVVAVDAGSP
jgi:hypothetical protein